jgi:hypothetical protein
MKWLIAFALLLSVPTAEIAAQEVNAAAWASATSLSRCFDASGRSAAAYEALWQVPNIGSAFEEVVFGGDQVGSRTSLY